MSFDRSKFQAKQWAGRSTKERSAINLRGLETRKTSKKWKQAVKKMSSGVRLGRECSDETRRKLSIASKGRTYPDRVPRTEKWNWTEEQKQHLRDTMYKKHIATLSPSEAKEYKARKKRQDKMKFLRKNYPAYYQELINKRVKDGILRSYKEGRKPVGTKMYKKFVYCGITMKSSYEMLFAKWLRKGKIKWKYEPKRFDLARTTYTPDFYIPKSNIWVETKGYASKAFWKKIVEFHKLYPQERLIVINHKKIKAIEHALGIKCSKLLSSNCYLFKEK